MRKRSVLRRSAALRILGYGTVALAVAGVILLQLSVANGVASFWLGFGASAGAWWFVRNAFVARITVSPGISKLPDAANPGTYRYRVKIVNQTWFWPAVGVELSANLRVKGLRSPKNISVLAVPVGADSRISILRRNRVVRLRVHDLPERVQTLFGEETRKRLADGSANLEELLSHGDGKGELELVISAAHPYGGTRRYWAFRYSLNDISPHRFAVGSEEFQGADRN